MGGVISMFFPVKISRCGRVGTGAAGLVGCFAFYVGMDVLVCHLSYTTRTHTHPSSDCLLHTFNYGIIVVQVQMLQEPHADNPLEADIARQLAEDRDGFNQTAQKWTLDFASP